MRIWKQDIVNAVTHRSYSIIGTEIQVKMFDDCIAAESPGELPGLVKAGNIRNTHFSRNPAEKSAFESKTSIIQTETPAIEENNPIIQNEKLNIEEMRCAKVAIKTLVKIKKV